MSAPRLWDRGYNSQTAFYEHAYGQQITSLKPAGSWGAMLLEAAQSAGDWSDAPTPDLTIAWLASAPVESSCDLGAGRFTCIQQTSEAILVAPGGGSSIFVSGTHTIRLLAAPYRSYLQAMPETRAAPPDGDFDRLHAGLIRAPKLTALLDELWSEVQSGAAHGAMFADGLLLQLAGTLLRLRDGVATAPLPARGGLALWQVRRICDLLQSDLSANPSLAELATLVGLSTEHFCRAFKASTGLPPHAWFVAQRVERARELLASTKLSVEEIAAQVGYAEPSHLARMFRRAHGVNPTQYRLDRLR